MAFGLERDADPPIWLPWLQVGASSLLAVLFVMLLIKSRDQNQRLQQLELRLQGVENNRSLDRTAALEQQMRSLSERMRGLERQKEELESTRRERDEMRAELRQLRSTMPINPASPAALGGQPLPVPPSSAPAVR